MSVQLEPIPPQAAAALTQARLPEEFEFAPDYPTEFTAGVAGGVGRPGAVGPFFIKRDGLIIGEIGGSHLDDETVELGYAIVPSFQRRGSATEALRRFVSLARQKDVARLVAHTPVARPESGRVTEKAGFTRVGEVEEREAGDVILAERWELKL